MSALPLLLALAVQNPPAAPPQAPARDTLVLRDGRRIEGKLVLYDRFAEMQLADNRKQRFDSWDVLRTDLAPDFIRVPELLPFPGGLLGRVDYTLLSWKSTLLAVPKQPGNKMVAVDVATLNKVWELDKPLTLVQEPFLVQSVLYLVTLEKDTHPDKRIKIRDNNVPKPVQKVTFKAVDVESCQTLWTETVENVDRNKMVWEFVDNPAPSLHVLSDRIVLRYVKEGWPIDAGVVDKTKGQKVATFVSYDPEKKRVSSTLESREAGDAGGKPFFLLPDTVLLQTFQRPNVFMLSCMDFKTGKLRWQTDWITGKLHEVTEESVFISDPTHFFAVLVKTGKKNEKWSVELAGGAVADLDGSHAYLYRRGRPPLMILGIDLRSGKEVFRLDAGPTDQFTHVALVGHRLIYHDKAYHLRCYDTVDRKELWKWSGLGQTIPGAPRMLGSGLSFYKDGRVTLLDPIAGQAVWEVKGTYTSIVQIGDEGILANKTIGSDLIRRRRGAAKEGTFLTEAGTPLRFALGVGDSWSLPAVDAGVAYSLSSGGWLVAADLKDRKLLWQERVSRTPLNPLARPFARDGNVAVHLNGETHIVAVSNKGRVYQVTHQPLRPDLQFEVAEGGLLATGRGSKFSLVDYASGKKLWESAAQGVQTYVLAGSRVYAANATNLFRLDAKTGAVEETQPGRGVTALAWDGKRAVAATGPYGFGFFGEGEEFKPAWKTQEQGPQVVQKFRGWIAAEGGSVFYSNADAELACFEGGSPEKPAWTFKTPYFTSLLLVHEGKVWFSSTQQGLFGLDAKTGAVAWKREMADAADYTPFLWEGKPAFWSSQGWILNPD